MVRHIKTALILVFMLAAFILTAKYGLYMATAFSLPAMLLWAFLNQYIQKWEHRELLKQYAVMIENIYEHSHYPGDREVRRRAQRHRAVLTSDGQEVSYRNGPEEWHQFHWPAEGRYRGAKIRARGLNGVDFVTASLVEFADRDLGNYLLGLSAMLIAYAAIPLQYWFVADDWYGMFAIFIPVYVTAAIAFRLVLAGETRGFIRSAGTLQWGLFLTVYNLSHLAFLTVLDVATPLPAGGAGLLLFVLILVEGNDVAQYTAGRLFGLRRRRGRGGA